MLKATFLILVCLGLTLNALDISKFQAIDPTEEEIEQLFGLYLEHEAPHHIEPTVKRYLYFKSQVLEIIAHNRDPASTWKRTINKFTGLTLEEHVGSAIMAPQYCSATNTISALGLRDLPSSFDWRTKGVVSPVKDQGNCGSCWTFSTTGAVESHWALYKSTSPPLLSEQQLVDCAGDFDNHGCNGGLPSQAFEYIYYAGGIESESNYPYKARDGSCKFSASKVDATVNHGSFNITEGDEEALLESLFNNGPVSVAFEVTNDFMSYSGGVYVGKSCGSSPSSVNHAVLAVGYGTDEKSGLDYWLVKNSWGTGWGIDGYFMIKRGVNMCGIATCASYPNISD